MARSLFRDMMVASFAVAMLGAFVASEPAHAKRIVIEYREATCIVDSPNITEAWLETDLNNAADSSINITEKSGASRRFKAVLNYQLTNEKVFGKYNKPIMRYGPLTCSVSLPKNVIGQSCSVMASNVSCHVCIKQDDGSDECYIGSATIIEVQPDMPRRQGVDNLFQDSSGGN